MELKLNVEIMLDYAIFLLIVPYGIETYQLDPMLLPCFFF